MSETPTLLFDRWHPVTHDFGLIEAPVAAVHAALTGWHAGIGIDYSARALTTLQAAFAGLPPLSAEKRRTLLLPTAAGWTAFLQSGIDGSDPEPPMQVLAQRMAVRSMRVCATPPSARWSACIWGVYAPPSLGGDAHGLRRSIAAANDGGRWVFHSEGELFDFEDPDTYRAPKKKERLDKDLLARYLANFGLAPFSDAFYPVTAQAPAVLLERKSRWEPGPPEFTLEQVVAGAPWAR